VKAHGGTCFWRTCGTGRADTGCRDRILRRCGRGARRCGRGSADEKERRGYPGGSEIRRPGRNIAMSTGITRSSYGGDAGLIPITNTQISTSENRPDSEAHDHTRRPNDEAQPLGVRIRTPGPVPQRPKLPAAYLGLPCPHKARPVSDRVDLLGLRSDCERAGRRTATGWRPTGSHPHLIRGDVATALARSGRAECKDRSVGWGKGDPADGLWSNLYLHC
jgi:hypothetical protein